MALLKNSGMTPKQYTLKQQKRQQAFKHRETKDGKLKIKKIKERKVIKQKLINTQSQRLQDQLQSKYGQKANAAKKGAWKDRRRFIDDFAEKANTASDQNS